MTLPASCTCLLLDLNGTLMFDGDRFGEDEDFQREYEALGGERSAAWVNRTIRDAFAWLEVRYPDPVYHESFPTLESAFLQTCPDRLEPEELRILVDLFSRHELGVIPNEFAEAVSGLAARFRLGLVADIWAPSAPWMEALQKARILDCFEEVSFSSDFGAVKPSPVPFQRVLGEMGAIAEEAFFVGDSVRRDLGGAAAAGMNCVLVGGAKDPQALAAWPSLLEFASEVGKRRGDVS